MKKMYKKVVVTEPYDGKQTTVLTKVIDADKKVGIIIDCLDAPDLWYLGDYVTYGKALNEYEAVASHNDVKGFVKVGESDTLYTQKKYRDDSEHLHQLMYDTEHESYVRYYDYGKIRLEGYHLSDGVIEKIKKEMGLILELSYDNTEESGMRTVRFSQMIEVDGERYEVDSPDIERCAIDGKYHKKSDMVELRSGRSSKRVYKLNINEETTVTCGNCGIVYEKGSVTFIEIEGRSYCPECNPLHMRDYSYKPNPRFEKADGESDPALYMGIELEVDRQDDDHDRDEGMAASYHPDFYYKPDGSLDSGDSFELVTHPKTLKVHQNLGWEERLKRLRRLGFVSHNGGTCGLHIHVNRTYLGVDNEEQDETIAKIVYLYESFWDEIKKFSRRRDRQIGEWAKRYGILEEMQSKLHLPSKKDVIDKLKNHGSRYMAVNLTNRHTVEFRIFRGTLKYESFIASLEFTSNLVNLAKDKSIEELRDISWTDIIEYEHFDELSSYNQSRGLEG